MGFGLFKPSVYSCYEDIRSTFAISHQIQGQRSITIDLSSRSLRYFEVPEKHVKNTARPNLADREQIGQWIS